MASKPKAPAKKTASLKGNINVDVTVDLAGRVLTKKQQAHLRALVKSQVITWVKDLGAPVPVIICDEHGPLPPPHHGGGGD